MSKEDPHPSPDISRPLLVKNPAKYDFSHPDFDIQAFATDPNHFSEVVGDELIVREVMHCRVVLIIDRKSLFSEARPAMEVVYLEDGTPFFTAVDSYSKVEITSGPVFNPFIVDIICQHMVQGGEGASLSKILRLPGMPSYHAFSRWRRANPWIEEALERARYDRAEVLRDEAIAHALDARDKNDAPAHALKYEAKKWGASLDNPKYSPKSKLDVNVSTPTVINVITGIDRTTDVAMPLKDVTKSVGEKT